ncbi:MAG TPA: NAD(P)H-hydrate epimerase [Gemmatimonadota bacterium]|nr:NAD(P)H-hydrate epimerase [Gemmatimonadota bacterium]
MPPGEDRPRSRTIPWAATSGEEWRRLPYFTARKMAEVDRLVVEEYGIGLLQMMENAGRCLAHLARDRFLGGDVRAARVTVLAGSGGNGGGALAAARRLQAWGAEVTVHLSHAGSHLSAAAARQLETLVRMDVRREDPVALWAAPTPDLVVDGLLGYGLSGAPRGAAATMIRWANGRPVPVLALDVPSGVDATTGTVHTPAVGACATLTLAAPKLGFLEPGALGRAGELYLADIGVPWEAFRRAGLVTGPLPAFSRSDIVRIG